VFSFERLRLCFIFLRMDDSSGAATLCIFRSIARLMLSQAAIQVIRHSSIERIIITFQDVDEPGRHLTTFDCDAAVLGAVFARIVGCDEIGGAHAGGLNLVFIGTEVEEMFFDGVGPLK